MADAAAAVPNRDVAQPSGEQSPHDDTTSSSSSLQSQTTSIETAEAAEWHMDTLGKPCTRSPMCLDLVWFVQLLVENGLHFGYRKQAWVLIGKPKRPRLDPQ